jgi:hypothetical protein
MLATFAALGPTAAADQSQATGINNQQNAGEEFSSQRRYRRGRVVVHRHWAPRYRYYSPGPYAYAPYPYAYAHPYPYRRYYRPGPFISFGVGPVGFGVW